MIFSNLRRDNSFGKVNHAIGDGYGPILGNYLVLLYVHEGMASVMVDGKTTVLSTGECCLTFSKTSYQYRNSASGNTTVFWMDSRPDAPHRGEVEFERRPDKIQATHFITDLLVLGRQLQLEESENKDEFRAALTSALIHAYLLAADQSGREKITSKTILEARTYILRNHSSEFNIRELASRLNVSSQYLVSGFKKAFEETPGKYLWRLRLEEGTFLLRRTELSVSEISFQCGFKSPYHFSRKVKELTGKSPTEYRVESRLGKETCP